MTLRSVDSCHIYVLLKIKKLIFSIHQIKVSEIKINKSCDNFSQHFIDKHFEIKFLTMFNSYIFIFTKNNVGKRISIMQTCHYSKQYNSRKTLQ